MRSAVARHRFGCAAVAADPKRCRATALQERPRLSSSGEADMLPSCRTCLVAVFLLLPVCLGADAQAQGPPLPPLPDHGPAPLLYVRLGGPAGMHVTFFQGQAPPRDFPAPVTVGLRPG